MHNTTRANVVIHDNRTDASNEDATAQAHTLATIERAFRFNGSVTVERVDVYLNDRGASYATQPDWLEHAIVVRYISPERAPMTIGAIQRAQGMASEFHS